MLTTKRLQHRYSHHSCSINVSSLVYGYCVWCHRHHQAIAIAALLSHQDLMQLILHQRRLNHLLIVSLEASTAHAYHIHARTPTYHMRTHLLYMQHIWCYATTWLMSIRIMAHITSHISYDTKYHLVDLLLPFLHLRYDHHHIASAIVPLLVVIRHLLMVMMMICSIQWHFEPAVA